MANPQKILIIEDDRLQYRVTERLLASARRAQFSPEWAQTYEDGVARLLTGDYAACLLDYQLGPHDGLELLREVRGRECHTPVIFLTADSSDEVDQAALEAGAADYLVKGQIDARMLERSIRYALKLGGMMAELRRLATRDALTGILNRRAFDTLMAEEVDRSRRLGHPLTLLMLDLDHFKSINDSHGHAGGDAVLVQLARLLEGEVRNIDRVARIGGEEFAVVLMETTAEQGIVVARRLGASVRAGTFAVDTHKGETLRVTVSIGVAELSGKEESATELLAAADRALYAAKHDGRDRAVLAS